MKHRSHSQERIPGLGLRRASLAVLWVSLTLAPWCWGQPHLDNQTQYSNQDPNTETRRSDHFRLCFGHFNRDVGTPMTEQLAQGNLQMYEQMWHRWVVEMGLHDINESATAPDGNKYRANFNFLMTWNDGGGGGAYSSMDGNGFFYAMANPGYCRFDPPSGATPHEFGHVWEGTCAGFNGSDSSGAWWECTANWMQLQFLNTYPQAGAYIYNGMYYPAHGRDYYDAFMIWEAAREDARYGAAWVNNVWTNANASQRVSEYIVDRMIRCDTSGSADKAGAVKDLWGDMAKKLVTWDFERQRWLATANRADDGSDWNFYQRCRTPMVKVPGSNGWYRPARAHLPMEFGFNVIPLEVAPNTTVLCNFQPQCDPVRQSDWRACLVAVNNAGEASYSTLWSIGTQAITLSAEQSQCYLVVIATPKPMKIADPAWRAYLTDAGLQFPYAASFIGATPKNVIYPPQRRTGMTQHAHGGGWKANTAVVDAAAYLGPNAQVLGTAQVRGTARIEDYAVVKDNARVTNAIISGHALVEGNAKVYGNAKVRDWGHVFGYAEVFENARVIEHANCGDGSAATHTKVYGNAVIKGTSYVYDPSTFNGCLIMEGDSANGNGTTPAAAGVHLGWSWGQDVARFSALPHNGYLYAQHTFEKENAVFAMDQLGINHGFLMNECRVAKDTNAPTRGGLVLPLNGSNQYVELHPSVNDFRDSTYAVWIKWTGGAPDQRVWSLGDGASKVMYLTPNDAGTSGLRFVISDGTTTQALEGGALSPGVWTHLAVVFSGAACTLYVNGAAVASDPAMTLFPDSLNAPLMENANYLGRGNAGAFFQGYLDDFRVSMKALSAAEVAAVCSAAAPAPVTIPADTAAPAPNAATWLVAPRAISDNAVTMSATPGTDASGWVEYYFACTSGGGHDSGWVSFNKYHDVGVTPGVALTYTVRMRDRNGNTTDASAPASVTCQITPLPAAAFSYGPVGIANGRIRMTAARPAPLTGKVEYRFDRTSPSAASSGWQSSPNWTHAGLTAGTTHAYTVTMRDGWGQVSSVSATASAVARDDAPPELPMAMAHWEMLPYATIDNKVSMTAMAPTDASGVEYQFVCVSGGGPSSAWQSGRTYLTPVLPDGTYVYHYRVRDTSAQKNTSGYSTAYAAKITPTTGYHTSTLSQALTHPDDYLVSFPATVMKVNGKHYDVKDLATGLSIKVRPGTSNEVTDAALALKNVRVQGHLDTFSGVRVVTFATVTATGDPPLHSISGRVTNSAGAGIAGATVYFADVPGAASHSILSAVTDATGAYSRGVTAGSWYLAAAASAYNTSADRWLTVSNGNLAHIDFGLVSNAVIRGVVTRRSDGAPVAGASVHFSRSPGASGSPVFTATAAADGTYAQSVQDGTWHVAAGASGFYTSSDLMLSVAGVDLGSINFSLKSSARNIPRTSALYFSAITDSLPAAGQPAGHWSSYVPSGQSFAPMDSPTVAVFNGVTWVQNDRMTSNDGFRVADYSANPAPSIPCRGVTMVAAVKPVYCSPGGEPRGEIVDILYDRLALAVSHSDGRVMVARNGNWGLYGTAIPNNTPVILSLVVQTNGAFIGYINGVSALTGGASGNFSTAMTPTGTEVFKRYVNIGRNNPDGWSAFNGYIGDVFVYTNALSDMDRRQLEADLTAKFIASDHAITASASAGGSINPMGTVLVHPGGTQTFTITAASGYAVADVIVDGLARGATSSWTFTDVRANHTIGAVLVPVSTDPPTLGIEASAPGTVVVSWPDSYSGQLLSSPEIGPGAVWTPVGTAPVVSGGLKRVTIYPGVDNAFYGLSQ
ncbi:MAG TPA: DUF6055 domain-containing protein [Verrucomicrobiota bacterium]|nr:DUF6055 domain-containing protein [Verrucomicrobiota bacterium]HNU51707.1 DUF6055 domain-containing protein [Verrucomicrobiota bacterium]